MRSAVGFHARPDRWDMHVHSKKKSVPSLCFELICLKLLWGHYHSKSISNLLLPRKMNDRSTRLIALLALIRRVTFDCEKYESLVALVWKDYLVIVD